MPDIDWPGIRAAAVTLGVRKAARHAAKDLTAEEQERFVFRALKRSQREGWVIASDAAKIADTPTGKPMSSIVLTGQNVIKSQLAEDSEATRASLSRAARRMAEDAEDAPLEQAGDALQVGKLAAAVHGWDREEGQRCVLAFFSIQAGAGDESPVIDV